MHVIHARYRRIFYRRAFMRAIIIDPRTLNFFQQIFTISVKNRVNSMCLAPDCVGGVDIGPNRE